MVLQFLPFLREGVTGDVVALDDSDMKEGSWDGVVSSSVSALLAGTSAMTTSGN